VLRLAGLAPAESRPRARHRSVVAPPGGRLVLDGFELDDVLVLVGHDDAVTFGSPDADGHYEAVLPADAILVRDNRPGGYFEPDPVNMGARSVRFRTPDAAGPSYTFLAGTRYNVVDLEQGGFGTRPHTQGVDYEELADRGWVGPDGVARFRFVLVSDLGGVTARVRFEGPSAPPRFLYAGQEHDPEGGGSGLHHMNARYYDPAAGRFVSQDPVGFAGGTDNLYAYVANNAART